MKLRCYSTTKEMVTRMKRQLKKWEKVFDSHTSEKELVTKRYRELKNQIPQKSMTQ
jgi:hypothetical protein